MVNRWIFTEGGTSVTLPINPAEMTGSLFPSLSVTSFATLRGRTLVTEGAPTAGSIQFSGVILEKAHYDLFLGWLPTGARGRRRITITDHFERPIVGILTSWQPTPQRAPAYPWKHSYVADFLVLSVGVAPYVP